jgi:tetratricopeptide (TPR) repeat protein
LSFDSNLPVQASPRQTAAGLGFIFLILTALLSISPISLAADHWIILTSPHFEALANVSERAARQKLDRLERFRHALAGMEAENLLNSLPTRVYLLAGQKELQKLTVLKRNLAKTEGMFMSSPHENFLAVDCDADDRSVGRVTHHEFAHLLFRDESRAWPLWMREGIAECFSTATFSNRRVKFGEPAKSHLQWLEYDGIPALASLFQIQHVNSVPDNKVNAVYASSWLVMHYLIFGLSEKDALKRSELFNRADRGTDTLQIFSEVFGWDINEVERRVLAYAQEGRFRFRQSELDPDFKVPITVRAAGPGEPSAWFGAWQLRCGMTNAAVAEFAACEKAAPNAPYTYFHLGLAHSQADRFEEAQVALRKAMALQPEDYRMPFHLARALVRENHESLDTSYLSEARSLLERSIELRPKYQPAHATLGLVEFRSPGRLQAAVNALAMALKLDPLDHATRFTLAKVLKKGGQPKYAREQLEILLGLCRHKELTAIARELLSELDAKADSSPLPAKAEGR